MAATARSWVAGSMVTTRPPAASQNSVTRLTASRAVWSVGVRMIVAPRKRSARATAHERAFRLPDAGEAPRRRGGLPHCGQLALEGRDGGRQDDHVGTRQALS